MPLISLNHEKFASESDSLPLCFIWSLSFFLLSPFLFAGFDLVKCEDPGIPNYGYKIRDEGHFIDTVILYSCNPGYTMHGSSIMTCLSGDRRVWDKPLPTCIGNMDCDNVLV